MENIDKLKQAWKAGSKSDNLSHLDKTAWQNLIKQRSGKQKNATLQYFWASFTYQLIVYGFLSYLILKYWEDKTVLVLSIICLLLYVPFTMMLFRKFKRLAVSRLENKDSAGLSMKKHILTQYKLITGFYSFKKRYEIILVPLSSAFLVWIIFHLYVSGGIMAYPIVSGLFFLLIIGACGTAIFSENKRNFKRPIKQLEDILKDVNTKLG